MMEALTSNAAKMPHALSLYSSFIAKNASAVTQIESGLRSLTYIIPGRRLAVDCQTPAN
jgi:peroxin-16